MLLRLVFAVGDMTHLSSSAAFTRLVEADFPVRRDDTVMCPITADTTIPITVVDVQVGGSEPVVVAYSDLDAHSREIASLATDPAWAHCQFACGLYGEPIGVFLNSERTHWVPVDDWPDFSCEQLQAMIEIGLIDNLPTFTVPEPHRTLETGLAEQAVIVPFPAGRERRPAHTG